MAEAIEDRLDKIISSLTDALSKLNEALESKRYFEAIALEALIINGSVTVLVIGTLRLKNGLTSSARRKLGIFTRMDDRELHRLAYLTGCITFETRDTLGSFYDKRNQALHRYIQEGLTENNLVDIASEGKEILIEMLVPEFNKLVYELNQNKQSGK